MKRNTVLSRKILFSLLIFCFFSAVFFKANAKFYDFTEDFYNFLCSQQERTVFKNFEKYLSENPSEKNKLVKKEFFNMVNDVFITNKIKDLGAKSVCWYMLDMAILKVFDKISIDDPESVKLASISLGENFEEVKEYLNEDRILGVTYFY